MAPQSQKEDEGKTCDLQFPNSQPRALFVVSTTLLFTASLKNVQPSADHI